MHATDGDPNFLPPKVIPCPIHDHVYVDGYANHDDLDISPFNYDNCVDDDDSTYNIVDFLDCENHTNLRRFTTRHVVPAYLDDYKCNVVYPIHHHYNYSRLLHA